MIMASNKSFRPSPAHLRAFIAIARHGHFGVAAQTLGVSQPSLSQSLAVLEEGLGRTLIERSTRRVIVTAEGEALLPYAEAVIASIDQFARASSGLGHGLEGEMTLGIIPTAAPYILPSLITAVEKEYPALSITVVEEQTERLCTNVREGKIDLALLALPLADKSIITTSLYQERFVLAVPEGHPLALADKPPKLQILREYPLLLLEEGHCLRDQAVDLCRSVGAIAGRTNTRATSLLTILQCVAAGMGITLLPESAMAVEQRVTGIRLIPFDEPAPGRMMGLAYRRSTTQEQDFERLGVLIHEAFTASLDSSAPSALAVS